MVTFQYRISSEVEWKTIEAMSLEARQTINCLAMFTGAITAINNPDEKALAYMRERQRLDIEPLYSDPDATYHAFYDTSKGYPKPTDGRPVYEGLRPEFVWPDPA